MFYLALLPAILLIAYICKKDKIEKEPAGLLVSLFFLGGVMIVPAGFLEMLTAQFLEPYLIRGTYLMIALENFLLVALIEEGFKLIALKLRTWRDPAFNYLFDGVVYAVIVSLGFAAVENVLYLTGGTFGLAVMRGLLSVPGHAIDGVFMGACYGLAKESEVHGNNAGKAGHMFLALLVPTLVHGFYDFCLSTESDTFFLIFIAFEIVVTIYAVCKVNRLSRNDRSLYAGVDSLTYGNGRGGRMASSSQNRATAGDEIRETQASPYTSVHSFEVGKKKVENMFEVGRGRRRR